MKTKLDREMEELVEGYDGDGTEKNNKMVCWYTYLPLYGTAQLKNGGSMRS